MPDEVKPEPKQAPTQDAQLAAENMASGQEQVPTVDMEADYAAAQQFSVSEIDRTGGGAQAAEAATASQFKAPEPEETKKTVDQPTGNPDDYLEMAEDAASSTDTGTNVSNDLINKALDMGKPGQ